MTQTQTAPAKPAEASPAKPLFGFRALLADLAGWIRRHLLTVCLVLFVILINVGTQIVCALIRQPFPPSLAKVSFEALARGRWYIAPISMLYVPNLGRLLIDVPLMLVAFGLAESVIGKIKTAWVSVITTLGGVALGMGLCSLSDGRSPQWHAISHDGAILGPLILVAGTLMCASAFTTMLWRRRIRVIGYAVVLIMFLYRGEVSDYCLLVTSVIGHVLGYLMASRTHGDEYRHGASYEMRRLIGIVAGVQAIGSLVAVSSRQSFGLLSMFGLLTGSTDFDTGDRLYFDPLNPESVDNIIATEKPDACVVQFGGQTAIKLAKHMDEIGLPILGTPADAIDEAEDRERFDELLERCNIPRAPGRTVFNLEEALAAADEIGLPVLMRPSYVLGGQNMIVAYTKADVIEYMGVITEHVDMDHPVLLDKYIMGTECEVDAICDGENYLIPGIMEQVERTGVHSGDSICVYPAQHLTQAEIDTMVDYTGRFARELHVTGLVNVQYAVSNGKVYVIEVNPRSSRTVPYISKVTGVPMVDLAVRCCLGEKLTDMGYGTGLHPNAPYVAVKVPVFSFEKLHGVDTQFGPEMKSTGEVLGIAPNFHDALLKGLIGAGYTFKTPGPASCCIFTVKDSDKPEFVDIAWKLKSMGYKLYGTSGTCAWLNKHMVPCNEVRNMSGEAPNIVDLLQSGLVDYVFSTSAKGRDPKRDSVRLRRKAVELSIPCITAVDTANALVNCLRSDHSMKDIPLVDIATLYHKK